MPKVEPKKVVSKLAIKPSSLGGALGAATSNIKKPLLTKKIVGGGNKFAVKSDSISAMGSKLGVAAAPKKVFSPLKLNVSSPGKVSPL